MHDHAKALDVRIPALVIEEQHLVVGGPGCLVQPGEMGPLVAREYLRVRKEIQAALWCDVVAAGRGGGGGGGGEGLRGLQLDLF